MAGRWVVNVPHVWHRDIRKFESWSMAPGPVVLAFPLDRRATQSTVVRLGTNDQHMGDGFPTNSHLQGREGYAYEGVDRLVLDALGVASVRQVF